MFYVLVEGVRWRSLPSDFPAWQTVYTYFRNWRLDGTWLRIHDRLREWMRAAQHREPSPSEAIIDSQSVKSAAMVSQAVGFDAGKLTKGRKRFLTVDTLGLVLRVLVTAANVAEREGGKQVLKRAKKMAQRVSRLHTIWVDGGNDCEPFMMWVMDVCRWIVQVVLRPEQTLMVRVAQKKVAGARCSRLFEKPRSGTPGGADFRLADGVSAIGSRL